MMLLGVDYGTVRIGLATGNTELQMAFPLRTLDSKGGDATMAKAVADVARAEGCEQIVVGVPVRLSGAAEQSAGDTETRARYFAELLTEVAGMPVHTEDERLTSALADSTVRASGGKSKHVERDAVAAAVLLETYMQRAARR